MIIPDSISYFGYTFPITEIGYRAFKFCDITSVVINEGVNIISESAFESCSLLRKVVIPNSVTEIQNAAFKSCSNLRSLTVGSGVTYVNEYDGYKSFSGCYNLRYLNFNCSANIPAAFPGNGLSNLDTLIVGENAENVTFYSSGNTNGNPAPIYLSYNCEINLTQYLTKSRLKRVLIGNNVTTIYSDAFNGADSLRIVTIGSGVTEIGEKAFRLCTVLDTIYALPTIAPTLYANVFQFTPATKVVVTPCNSGYSNTWGTTGFNYVADGLILTLFSNNTNWGFASFVQPVNCTTQSAVIQATANTNYAFDSWSDGNTDNPRTISLTQNTTLIAYFWKTHAVFTAQSANELMGIVTGGGSYPIGDTVSLSAIANCNYRFVCWQDSITDNPRLVVAENDTSFLAYFELNSDTVFVPIHDTTYVDVFVHDTTIVHDTTYVDVPYPVHDTTTIVDTMTITDTITVVDTLWLTQYDTVWLYDTVTIHDTIYIHDEGIEDVDILNARIFQRDGRIVVESGDGGPLGEVRVFDVTGRMLTHSSVSPQGAASSPNLGEQFGWRATFDVPTSGTYIVKIGDHPAKKIMVIR